MNGGEDKAMNITMTEQEKQLALEARRAYQREWNRKNPGKAKEYQMRFWLKKARENSQSEAGDGPKLSR